MSSPSNAMLSSSLPMPNSSFFFFFNDTATTEIYTLSLHDALPISLRDAAVGVAGRDPAPAPRRHRRGRIVGGRKSTRLKSSHRQISYAVFCLEKKKRARESIEHQVQPRHWQWAQLTDATVRRLA